MTRHGLPFYALILAWLGIPLTLSSSPSWVSLLRDFLYVGCSIGHDGEQAARVCPDGVSYILNGAMPAVTALAASVFLAVMQLRFHHQPTLARWYPIIGTVIAIPAIFGIIFVQAAVSSEALSQQWPVLALISCGIVFLVLAAIAGKYRWPSVLLTASACALFGSVAVVNYGALPVALLGGLVGVVSLADRVSSRFKADIDSAHPNHQMT